jgi:hypothetical protein
MRAQPLEVIQYVSELIGEVAVPLAKKLGTVAVALALRAFTKTI